MPQSYTVWPSPLFWWNWIIINPLISPPPPRSQKSPVVSHRIAHRIAEVANTWPLEPTTRTKIEAITTAKSEITWTTTTTKTIDYVIFIEIPKLPEVRELLVWLPLKSDTPYLTLYDLATLLRHLKRTRKLICTIRHLPPDSPPIHCDPSQNACLVSRAWNFDVNLT